ncbi:MAG TPA: DUF3644 domain-containing protein [Herpetosiphon sp.]|uniref:DUF3644 domain-containing protein n=1 Tax=Herpetosiphon aurantiacus (strain ATCC 23779 / DSM 785 / 114-95) TaxID=316274 RepID=A9B7R4_HERA2|nr:DUF3644 domain-containing protein [Herpetosiphon sp.]ABX04442.1 hypothetical protein Haur_1799 [Herpetosiphon aurantiacus DSM 785]HBW52306.1 DUF3644 domain-containing protein [Herpetosiphon sp.]
MTTSSIVTERKESVRQCLISFGFPEDTEYSYELLTLSYFPSKHSKKTLAFLILTYKQECPVSILKRVSDQPAGIVRSLRDKGFVFKSNPNDPSEFQYQNQDGIQCRSIESFDPHKIKVGGRAKALLSKALAAVISSIEIYNKPDFRYREETFAILLVNAWELLLKSKIMADNNNQISSIQVFDSSGFPKQTRSGNIMTIDIIKALNMLSSQGKINKFCTDNLVILVELRDNSIHFINKNTELSKKVLELGTASLKNFVSIILEWFDEDLSHYNFFLMPISFFHVDETRNNIFSSDKELNKLISFIYNKELNNKYEEDSDYSITLAYEVKFKKVSTANISITTNKEDTAVRVYIDEDEKIKNQYPIDSNRLKEILASRYIDFKANKRYHQIRKSLENQEIYGERYCCIRYLNSITKKGTHKKFYSTEIIKEFDKHYQKR